MKKEEVLRVHFIEGERDREREFYGILVQRWRP